MTIIRDYLPVGVFSRDCQMGTILRGFIPENPSTPILTHFSLCHVFHVPSIIDTGRMQFQIKTKKQARETICRMVMCIDGPIRLLVSHQKQSVVWKNQKEFQKDFAQQQRKMNPRSKPFENNTHARIATMHIRLSRTVTPLFIVLLIITS